VFVTVCPSCGEEETLTDRELGRPVQCPHCGEFYLTGDTPSGSSHVIQQVLTTRLTSPHRCQHPRCRWSIDIPVGRRECTISCPGCGYPTSVYAVVYRCTGCQAILESPANLLTRTAPRPHYLREEEPSSPRSRHETCPACRRSVPVPFDVVDRRSRLPLQLDEFQFACPNCRKRLQSGKRHAGLRAVCPECLYVVSVPRYGEAETEMMPRAADPRETLSIGGDYACPHCGNHIPVRSAACPVCSRKV
jgi:predicted RNA-binding Zn-ribbon protein involved in translation (DUF1610 family)